MAIRWNEARLQQMAQSPTGPVGKFLEKQGAKVESHAKVLATQEGLVRTGRYRASITARVGTSGGGLVLQIGSAVPYARYLEEGTEAHTITAGNATYLAWRVKPNHREGWVRELSPFQQVRQVSHPGNRAYRILQRAIEEVLGGSIAASVALGG